MGVFEATARDTNGEMLHGPDPESGLKAIIAHNSIAPGFALDGTRSFPHDAVEAVIGDDRPGNGAIG